MSHPYTDLPDRAFWKSAVAEADRSRFPGLVRPRFGIDRATRVATAGSCFAQHIGRYLRLAGCRVLDAEPSPRGMGPQIAKRFGYGLFSARYGNIYTARQLRQLLEDAASGHVDRHNVWLLGEDRFVDAFRPTVEPEGLHSEAEVLAHREDHLLRLAGLLGRTDVFIFTLGLTEAWEDQETGRVYPVCPGVAGGRFDRARFRFRNFSHSDVLADLEDIQRLLRSFQTGMELLLTVSPVPMTATASDDHVLTATTYSKAVLRAAAGEFVATADDVDYFPSYEIVTAPASGGPFFEPNMRSVSIEGIEKVMGLFLDAHGLLDAPATPAPAPETYDDSEDEVSCDEVLLEAFSR